MLIFVAKKTIAINVFNLIVESNIIHKNVRIEVKVYTFFVCLMKFYSRPLEKRVT